MRTTISYTKPIGERAKALMKARGIRGMSKLLDILIREEYERRHAPIIALDITKSLGADEDESRGGAGDKPKPPKH